jgi:acyl dehydratase
MAEPRVFAGVEELKRAVGEQLGYSDWVEVDQKRIDLFAEATGDHQWIHVDPARAAAGPFGTTIAHGYLTLSLVNHFLPQVVEVKGMAMGINYGLDRVRFPAPLPVGSQFRGGIEIIEVTEVPGGFQVKSKVTIEVQGSEKPACVAETLVRLYG